MRRDSNATQLHDIEAPERPLTPQILTISGEALLRHTEEPNTPHSSELPFTIRLVRTEVHLSQAVQVRAQAFIRHAPVFGNQLLEPESADRAKGNVILLASSKATGEPQGSLRIETNFNVRTEFESLIELPSFLHGKTLAQVGRLGIKSGPGSVLVKYALFKALYRYCLATQVDYMLVAARTPVDREFIKLGFTEAFEYPTLLSFPSQGKKCLRLFVFDVVAGERTWRQERHPLYKFMTEEYHPDIEIFSSVRGMWSTPRAPSKSSPALRLLLPFDFPVV